MYSNLAIAVGIYLTYHLYNKITTNQYNKIDYDYDNIDTFIIPKAEFDKKTMRQITPITELIRKINDIDDAENEFTFVDNLRLPVLNKRINMFKLGDDKHYGTFEDIKYIITLIENEEFEKANEYASKLIFVKVIPSSKNIDYSFELSNSNDDHTNFIKKFIDNEALLNIIENKKDKVGFYRYFDDDKNLIRLTQTYKLGENESLFNYYNDDFIPKNDNKWFLNKNNNRNDLYSPCGIYVSYLNEIHNHIYKSNTFLTDKLFCLVQLKIDENFKINYDDSKIQFRCNKINIIKFIRPVTKQEISCISDNNFDVNNSNFVNELNHVELAQMLTNIYMYDGNHNTKLISDMIDDIFEKEDNPLIIINEMEKYIHNLDGIDRHINKLNKFIEYLKDNYQ